MAPPRGGLGVRQPVRLRGRAAGAATPARAQPGPADLRAPAPGPGVQGRRTGVTDASTEPVAHSVRVLRNGHPLASRRIEGRGDFRMAAASTVVLAARPCSNPDGRRRVPGAPEELVQLSEVEAPRAAGVEVTGAQVGEQPRRGRGGPGAGSSDPGRGSRGREALRPLLRDGGRADDGNGRVPTPPGRLVLEVVMNSRLVLPAPCTAPPPRRPRVRCPRRFLGGGRGDRGVDGRAGCRGGGPGLSGRHRPDGPGFGAPLHARPSAPATTPSPSPAP